MTDALHADGLTPSPERPKARHPKGVRRGEAQMDLDFVKPVLATPTREIVGMVRGTDPIESQAAAVRVKHDCAWIRWRLKQIATTEGPQTARNFESRTEFRGFAPNTIRKRVSELHQSGELVQYGREDGMAKWGIPK